MRRSAEVSVGPVRVIKYSEFVRNLVVPTNLNLVHVKPLRGTRCSCSTRTWCSCVVDNLFGGDGRFHTRVEGRDFTQTEQRIIQRLLEIVFDGYGKAWQPVYPLEFEYVRAGDEHAVRQHRDAQRSGGRDHVRDRTSARSAGEIHICMPYSMLEPIRDLLSSSHAGRSAGGRQALGRA